MSTPTPSPVVDETIAVADTAKSPTLRFVAAGKGRLYDIFLALFVSLLLVSNVAASKLIGVDLGWIELVFDGGAVTFPLTYILGDVLSEVYGFRGARRAVLLGFVVSITGSAIFWIVSISPAGPGDLNDAAFSQIFGFVPRIVAASLAGYLVGQLLNALVLVRLKGRTGERLLWIRMVASTLVGELADTVIFCTVAFAGLISGADFLNYVITGYVYKCAIEIILSPLSMPAISWVKHRETEYKEVSRA